MSKIKNKTFSRRSFMKAGGALVVMAGVPLEFVESAARAIAAGSFYAIPDVNSLAAWMTVNADGSVVARSSHVELGHGIWTGLAQIVAEELDVEVGKVQMVLGNTDTTPDQGGTFGSTTIPVAGTQWRQIAAEGRAALLKLASARLGMPVAQLTVKNGTVSGGSQTVTYGQLVQGQVLTFVAPITYKGGANGVVGSAKPKSPSQYTIVGQSVPRVDIPDKVTAKATYVVDVKVPNMLHARVIHPKGIGSTVVSLGGFSTPVPGAKPVQMGNLVAVVAEREWDAIKGAAALQVTWSDWNKLPTSTSFYDVLRTLKTTDRVIINRGDVNAALATAARKLQATYTTPFENHAMIGPSCAVADVKSDGSITIYSATQYPQGLQKDIAQMMGVAVNQVQVLRFEGSGEYGRLSANYDDAASEAVYLSKQLGRPVRVQWMRADEHRWEPHGPGTVHDVKAGLDGAGNIVAYVHEAWMPPNNDSTELGASLATGKPFKSSGTGGWTGPDLYTFANLYEVGHGLPELGAADTPYGFGLRTSFLRSPGQYQITFAQEAFIDEMAAAAKQDPLQFRLAHLTDERAIAVLKAAANKAGWEARTSPKSGASAKSGTVSGQGIALVLRSGTYAAAVVKASVDTSTGKILVQEVTVAQDNGLSINPLAIEHQNESSVIQTLSRAMYEEVTFDSANVTSLDWKTYPIATMMDAPKINFVLINHPEISPTGVGEPSTNLMAPALSSAIHDATGVRIRTLPMRPDKVKAALSA